MEQTKMTKDQAQREAERRWEKGVVFAFVFEVPLGFVLGTAERGGGRCQNFREVGFGKSWEEAFTDADSRINEQKPILAPREGTKRTVLDATKMCWPGNEPLA
jgi:hypothetical protein